MGQWQKRSETQEKFCFTFLKLQSEPLIFIDHLIYETSKHGASPLKLPSFCTVLFYPFQTFDLVTVLIE